MLLDNYFSIPNTWRTVADKAGLHFLARTKKQHPSLRAFADTRPFNKTLLGLNVPSGLNYPLEQQTQGLEDPFSPAQNNVSFI